MPYDKRLYHILYPNHALVASQVDPEAFAQHYQVGSTRYYMGKLIFAEIDPDFRHEFFNIEWGLHQLIPHEDGRPKATKFISSYRVLEHIDLAAIKSLYLVTQEGYCQQLQPQKYETTPVESLRVYVEICPVRMLTLTDYSAEEFGQYITNPKNPKGAPKIFFSRLDMDIEDFLRRFEENPFIPRPSPPSIPRSCGTR